MSPFWTSSVWPGTCLCCPPLLHVQSLFMLAIHISENTSLIPIDLGPLATRFTHKFLLLWCGYNYTEKNIKRTHMHALRKRNKKIITNIRTWDVDNGFYPIWNTSLGPVSRWGRTLNIVLEMVIMYMELCFMSYNNIPSTWVACLSMRRSTTGTLTHNRPPIIMT